MRMSEQEIDVSFFGNEAEGYTRLTGKAAEFETQVVDTASVSQSDIENVLQGNAQSFPGGGWPYTISEAVELMVGDSDPMGDGKPEALPYLATAIAYLGARKKMNEEAGTILQSGIDDVKENTVDEYVLQALKKVRGDGTPGDPGWTGESAYAFEEFVDIFNISETSEGATIIRQWWLLYTMFAGVQAIQEVQACARRDVYDMLQTAINAIDGQDEDATDDGIKGALTITAAVVPIVASVVTPGAAGWTIAAAFTALADQSYAAANTAQEITVASSDSYNTLLTVVQYLIQIKNELDAGVNKAVKAMQDAADVALENKAKFAGPSLEGPDGTSPLGEDRQLDESYDDGFIPP